MTQVLQSGQHPDADQINAFAEHALPAHEQQRMLAHLAACPECRAIAYLAQPMFVEETTVPRPVAARRPWFSGWSLALPAGLAVAFLVILSVHVRNINTSKRETQVDRTARVEQPPSVPETALPSPQVVPPAAIPSPIEKSPIAPVSSVNMFTNSSTSSRVISGDAHRAVAGGSLAGLSTNRPPTPDSEGLSDDTIAGQARQATVAAAPKPTGRAPAIAAGAASAPASSATQMAAISNIDAAHRELRSSASQYDSAAATAQNSVNQAFAAPPPPAPPAPSPPTPGSGTQTVTVSSAPAMLEPESNASAQVIEGRALEALDVPSLKMRKQSPSLPSHLPALSTVSNSRHVLAVDTAGSLFRSEDAGVSWRPVPAQWAGRAVKLQLSPAQNAQAFAKSSNAAVAATDAEKSASKNAPQTAFELTNQAGEVWTSPDGQTWKHK